VSQVATAVDIVGEEVALAGVKRVVGLPGGEVLQLIKAFRLTGIEFTLTRHEGHAGNCRGASLDAYRGFA
jgi:thiamine pyrophosphate-dependent acetolactate synthase large subunit-like protein